MIIKDFAKLCNCNPQTLRYYDNIGLLRPVKVDQYTGYRHYSAEQALQYLKIKKLQDALFTIEEIRGLLDASDDMIFEALNKKIAEQQAKLKEIKGIQKSYQKEMKEMKEKVEKIKETMMKDSMDLDFKKEFGISQDEYFEIINALNEIVDQSLSSEAISIETDVEDEKHLIPSDYELIFELIGFSTIKEAIKKMPKFESSDYYFHINYDPKYKGNYAFTAIVTQLISQAYFNEVCGKVDFHFEFEPTDKFFKIYKKY